ncbi:MAG: sulfatase [bacterium]|nr:sulfatase [bacterium]
MPNPQTSMPNVVILHTHDTGRHLGVYGRGPHTPNLDRLAAEGVVFENAFCSAPQCSPSRSSLFTGMMPHRNGMIGLAHRGFRLNPDALEKHLAAVLTRAGYGTYLFGMQHETTQPEELGYTHIAPCESRKLRHVVPAAEAFFQDAPKEPFLAVIATAETHRVFTEGKPCRGTVQVPPYLPEHPDVQKDINNLNCDVEAVDDGFGRVLEAIDGAGLRDRTLVIYTTDHGIAFPGAKSTLFDPGIETTLIARGPGGFEGGKRLSGLVSNVDLFPTLMDLLGLDGHDSVEGKSLLPLVRGEVEEINSEIFVEQTYHAGYDPMRGVRTQRFKYTRNFEPRN